MRHKKLVTLLTVLLLVAIALPVYDSLLLLSDGNGWIQMGTSNN